MSEEETKPEGDPRSGSGASLSSFPKLGKGDRASGTVEESVGVHGGAAPDASLSRTQRGGDHSKSGSHEGSPSCFSPSLRSSEGGDHDVCPALAIGAGYKHLGVAGDCTNFSSSAISSGVEGGRRSRLSRKKFIGICCAGAAVVGLGGVAAYARWGETSKLTVTEIDIDVPSWAGTEKSARFVVAGDFHVGPDDAKRLEKIVALMRSFSPDAFLLLGDFYKGMKASDTLPIEEIVRRLSPLLKDAPAFACLGNHEAFFDNRKAAATLEGAGIRTFYPEAAEIFETKRGEKIVIAGTLDADTYLPENVLLPDIPEGAKDLPSILLSHSPDIVENLKEKDDFLLTLCGHTHGGQICLPGGQAIYTSTKFVGLDYVYGLHDIPGSRGKIFVTRGLGTSSTPFRLFCPPEIVVVNLTTPKGGTNS